MKIILKNIFIVSLTSFVLHFVWEYWQCSIFYIMPPSAFSSLMVKATFGYVILSIVLFAIIALADEDLNWLATRWSYSDAMPLFFNTDIGLILSQLLVLFPLSFFASRKILQFLEV
jgi:hypothetical protein